MAGGLSDPSTDRRIVGIGDTNQHLLAVGIKDGYIVYFALEGKLHPAVEWSDGSVELTASVPEKGIEAITRETDLQAVRTGGGRPVV